MGRRQMVDGGRPHVVTVRLSDREFAALERARGRLERSAFIRQVVLRVLNT